MTQLLVAFASTMVIAVILYLDGWKSREYPRRQVVRVSREADRQGRIRYRSSLGHDLAA